MGPRRDLEKSLRVLRLVEDLERSLGVLVGTSGGPSISGSKRDLERSPGVLEGTSGGPSGSSEGPLEVPRGPLEVPFEILETLIYYFEKGVYDQNRTVAEEPDNPQR